MATEMNMDMVENTTEPVSKNFIEMIIEKDLLLKEWNNKNDIPQKTIWLSNMIG